MLEYLAELQKLHLFKTIENKWGARPYSVVINHSLSCCKHIQEQFQLFCFQYSMNPCCKISDHKQSCSMSHVVIFSCRIMVNISTTGRELQNYCQSNCSLQSRKYWTKSHVTGSLYDYKKNQETLTQMQEHYLWE